MMQQNRQPDVFWPDQAYRTKEEAKNAYYQLKLMDTHTFLISKSPREYPYLLTFKQRVPQYLQTGLWKRFTEFDNLPKNITNFNKKRNTPLFNKFADAYLKWLASDISIEKSRKEQFWNNNIMDENQKRIW